MSTSVKRLGILGGGQLGLLLCCAARDLGVVPIVFDPDPLCPASSMAHQLFTASYEDEASMEAFSNAVDVITFEFENIPSNVLEKLEKNNKVCPSSFVLKTCRNRIEEKTFLKNLKIPVVPFEVVKSKEDLLKATHKLKFPCVLKTAELGYDGKGQYKLLSEEDVSIAWEELKKVPCVLEAWCEFQKEISVIVVRNEKGEKFTFPVTENIHTNHILDISIVPAEIKPNHVDQALSIAQKISDSLEVVGLVCAEMFVVGDEIWVNELAPRPHNSGHHTLESCTVSQFEAQVRAVCELEFVEPKQKVTAAVMVNILGQDWHDGGPSLRTLDTKNFMFKDYGKHEARKNRKMGHFTVWGDNRQEVLLRAKFLKEKLKTT